MSKPSSTFGAMRGQHEWMRGSRFWAKTTPDGEPGISVRDHCLNVGCVAEAITVRIPKQVHQLLPPGATTLAALHDVGKISFGFQQKCRSWMVENSFPPQPAETDHAKVSQWFLNNGSTLKRAN
jgi:CRISPR-associated endonuclease/helicase Cas3